MNRFFSIAKAIILQPVIRHSFVPEPRRQPMRMPVIPLRSKRPVRQLKNWQLRDRLQQQLDDVKSIEFNWKIALNLGLAVLLLVSGIMVVHFSYQNRQQVIELAELRSDRDQLQQSWTYLMRDQNRLSEFSRIETTAQKSLQMHRPDKEDIYILRSI